MGTLTTSNGNTGGGSGTSLVYWKLATNKSSPSKAAVDGLLNNGLVILLTSFPLRYGGVISMTCMNWPMECSPLTEYKYS